MIFPPSSKVGIGFSLCQRDLYLPGQGPHVHSEEPLFYKSNFLIDLWEGWKKKSKLGSFSLMQMQPRKRCYISKAPKTCTGPRKVDLGKRKEEHPVWSTQRSFWRGTPSPCSKNTQVVGRNLLLPTSNLKHKCNELEQFKQMHLSKL